MQGALSKAARKVSKAGRYGDDHLVHMNGDEVAALHEAWGPPTIHPKTGLPEYFSLKKLLSKAAPAALAFIPGIGGVVGGAANGFLNLGLGTAGQSVLGSALMGGGLGALTGGGKGALTGALLGGGTAAALPYLNNALLDTGVGNFFDLTQSPTITDDPRFASSGVPDGLGGTFKVSTDAALPPPTAESSIGSGALAKAAGSTNSGFIDRAIAAAKTPVGMAAIAGTGGLLLSQKGGEEPVQQGRPQGPNSLLNAPLDPMELHRANVTPTRTVPQWYTYGYDNTAKPFFENSFGPPETEEERRARIARGQGVAHAADGGYFGGGPEDGRADSIPARLSNDEYVMDAESVALLGDGSPAAGAHRLDQLRSRLRQHKGKALARGKVSPDAKLPEQYMRGGR